ncbi:hypothetical protein F4808DRAFT_307627 [Astrocystis sublimbata]|nr:hypothetical protein F4808DRAFT_307627 [Astrocystis sublimbata]
MAFNGFANANANANAAAACVQGSPLPEVQTEGLGFLSLAGEAKLRLSSPWSPSPSPHASLLSIASRRGLVAAAGPDAVVVASTDAVRKAFEAPKDGESESETRPFTPQLKIPLPIRIGQLAFSADDAYLILSAEQGGGLAVYDVNALQQGTTQSAFEISTSGESLRALVPNPLAEKAELCAVVTNGGKLLMANLKERNFMSKGSQILKEQVSCVSWSTKGKQLVAGLADGTLCQLTPEGDIKAEIPRPPELDSNYYVSTVVWLENNLFLVFHVSSSNGPQTKCHMITRQGQEFQFQGLNDPVDPYTAEKVPHHTALRLKDFPPNLQDLLIFSSSATPDIGLLARSNSPLAPNGPVNVFSNVELADDSRRATLPMGEDMESMDTPAAIGISLDLSGKDKVYKPIPTDERDESPGPLPGYWVLNEQGILSVWWVVYSESIREGTTYPGLAVVEGGNSQPASAIASQTTQSAPFGGSTSSPFGSATAPAAPAFGGPSALGAKSSPWGGSPATAQGTGGGATFGSSTFGSTAAAGAPKAVFGTSTFGMSSTPAAPAFGQSTGLGTTASPWGAQAAPASTPSFGQSGFASASGAAPAPFGSTAASNSAGGNPFSSFAAQGGFAAVQSTASADKPSIFSSTKPGALNISQSTDTNTSFPPSSSKPSSSSENPFRSQPFQLTSSFKPDTSSGNNDVKPTNGEEKSLFGSGFASTMNEAEKPSSNIFGGSKVPDEPKTSSNIFGGSQANEATKSSNGLFGSGQSLFGKPASNTAAESTTPTTTPAPVRFSSPALSAPANNGLFSFPPSSHGGLFAKTPAKEAEPPQLEKPAPEETPLPPESTNNAELKKSQSQVEDLPLPPDSPESKDTNIISRKSTQTSAVPLPPDPVRNKAAYSTPLPSLPGQSVKPKAASDAPLPPDPISNKKAYANKLPPLPGAATETKKTESAPLPPDPVKQPKAYESKLSAMAVAYEPTAVAGPGFKFPTTLPPVSDSSDDDDDDREDEATEAASEGSGVDVAKDLSPPSAGANRTPGYTPQGSFDGGLGGSYSTISRPEPERRSLFLSQNQPVLPRPNPVSPRSPSPVRGAIPPGMANNDHARSFSAPGMASQILGAHRKQSQSRLNGSIMGRDVALENAVMEQQKAMKAKKEAEEAQLLVDEEDDAVQRILRTEVEPTLNLDEFIAHSGVVPPAGDSVPAQVEAVYRDINSMIDTLGLNARSLRAWNDGNRNFASDDLSKQDLAAPAEWTLGDVEQLTYIIDRVLGEALEEAKVTDVEGKVGQVQDLQRDVARDCNKQADIRKIIATRLDPEQTAAYQALPLSAEQAAQQSDLRRQLGRFQTLLAQAEQDLTLLKAKIVSVHSNTGKGGPVPTIDAIVRTITKMTTMVEKRSGDIDVLENQMRKLRLGSAGPPGGSREGSPFTPKRTLGSSIFSPDRSTREATPMRASFMRHSLSGSRHSLSGSISGIGGDIFRTPPRKTLGGFTDIDRKAAKEKKERRAAVIGKLRNSITAKGPNVVPIDDHA